VGFFDTAGAGGALLQGLNEDCNAVQAAIGDKLSLFVYMLAAAVAGIAIAFSKGWDMTLVLMALFPVLAATGAAMGRLVAALGRRMSAAYAAANALAAEALGNVRTVAAFGGEERSVAAYDAALEAPAAAGVRAGWYTGLTLGMANCVAYCGYALAMWYGARRVADGAYTGGDVLNVLFAALIGGFALGQAVPSWQYFGQGQVAAARVYAIMRRAPAVDVDGGGGEELKALAGAVELRGVCFAYPARLDKPVFDDFSLFVPAGKTVALVGESGSGKSTVVQLIERFYDPQSGAVLLDGVDIRRLNLRWLRAQMGLVSQEPTLFATTIRDNILYGKQGASQAEVEAAAKLANAHAFIAALPQGYDTYVGEKGAQMSGGQKQRIAIARALLKDPKVLLLDEATSALDSQSEHIVQEALDRLMVGRTTIVVAHRLSTVRGADAIALVSLGKIVERGTHAELMKLGGAYTRLVQHQLTAK
jgi:ATP-binding cassette subfamily B (MDR/TAP) protein 1